MTPLSNATFVEHLIGSIRLVLPEIALLATACVLFTLAAFRVSRGVAFLLALAGLFAAFVITSTVVEPTVLPEHRSLTPVDPSGVAVFVRWLALAAAALYIFVAWGDTEKENWAEYLGCLLVLAAGLSLVGRANDLITLFLSLEMISIPTYVLLYLPSRTGAGREAAMKYFFLSVLSAGVLLFGMSYLYGVTGAINLHAIVKTLTAAAQAGPVSPLAVLGIIFVIAGLGFRITAVPFHFYAPDVYQGGPNGVVAQLAVVPKVAGFVAIARFLGLLQSPVFELPFDMNHTLVPLTLWVIAAVTMTFGNLLALLQDNLRRLLAYSGIAHGGYMLIGLLVALSVPASQIGSTQSGIDALLFYLVAYGLMTIGAFAVLGHLAEVGHPVESVDDLAGLGKSHPLAALGLALFLISMIGLPLTAGFTGKFLLFFSAFEVPVNTGMKNMFRGLAVLAAVNAAVAAVYYLRVIGVMYLRSPLQPLENRQVPGLAGLAATACAIATVALGVYPQPLLDAARRAVPVKVSPDSPAPANAIASATR